MNSNIISHRGLKSLDIKSLFHLEEIEVNGVGQGHVLNFAFCLLPLLKIAIQVNDMMCLPNCCLRYNTKSTHFKSKCVIGVFSPVVFEISITPKPYKLLTWDLSI